MFLVAVLATAAELAASRSWRRILGGEHVPVAPVDMS
jgi:hypothetical protein